MGGLTPGDRAHYQPPHPADALTAGVGLSAWIGDVVEVLQVDDSHAWVAGGTGDRRVTGLVPHHHLVPMTADAKARFAESGLTPPPGTVTVDITTTVRATMDLAAAIQQYPTEWAGEIKKARGDLHTALTNFVNNVVEASGGEPHGAPFTIGREDWDFDWHLEGGRKKWLATPWTPKAAEEAA